MSDIRDRTTAARLVARCIGQPGMRNDFGFGAEETFVILLSTDLVSDLMDRTAKYGATPVRLAISYVDEKRLTFAKFTHLSDVAPDSETVRGGSTVGMLVDAAQTIGPEGFAFTYAGAGAAQVDNVVTDDEDRDLLV